MKFYYCKKKVRFKIMLFYMSKSYFEDTISLVLFSNSACLIFDFLGTEIQALHSV